MFARRLHRMPLALVGVAALLLAACSGSNSGTDDSFNPANCYYTYTLTGSPQLEGLDPLLTYQWHLENIAQSGGTTGEDIRAIATWPVTKGGGIRVAVVDDAVETVHHELSPNLAAGAVFDYRSGTATAPLPCYADDDHGTAVAGIILARDDNEFGGAGVAPRASLAAYHALATSTDADIADALNRDLAGNAIYNNSWGSPDNGMLNRAEASFVSAIRYGIATGRDRKGAIYVFPGGNGGCYLVDDGGECAFDENSNYDGYVNQLGVIAACAVDDDGRAPLYAEPGANLLVCGPSGNAETAITTTDVQNGFRSDFSGTSASTPMVSGAAALILSANPELTWRDVRLILANSARQNDPLDSGWIPGTGGRRPFNPLYGFGAADAQAAVALARTWSSVGNSESLLSCGPYVRGSGASPFPILIPDAPASGASQAREDAIAVGGECEISKIEFVEIRFSATHAYSGDLRVDLISPNGLVSRLADARLCDPDQDGSADSCGVYDDWPFGSVRHLDEPAPGSWRLQVSDLITEDAGRWNGWSLRFWGRR